MVAKHTKKAAHRMPDARIPPVLFCFFGRLLSFLIISGTPSEIWYGVSFSVSFLFLYFGLAYVFITFLILCGYSLFLSICLSWHFRGRSLSLSFFFAYTVLQSV